MMKNNLAGMAFLCVFMTMAGCSKDSTLVTQTGMIIYDQSDDGCGPAGGGVYMFVADRKWYKPDQLAEKYEVDTIQVEITYRMTEETHNCGFGGYVPVIHIVKIKEL
jgi:hypothetical protein